MTSAPTPVDSLENEKALNPTVVKLGLVSLFSDISSEMLYPITPLFLTTVLGASGFHVGLIEGVAEGVASLLKTYAGRVSDRLEKRKIFVIAGYFLAAIAKPLTGAAHSWWTVLTARSLDRFGKGIRTAPRDALLAESVAAKFRGAAFGWHRMMDTLGAAIGPILALWFLQTHREDLRSIYFWAVIPGLVSVCILFWVHDQKSKAPRASEKSSAPALKWSALNPEFKTFLSAWGLFSLTNSSDVFLILGAQKAGLSFTLTVALYALYNLVYSLSSPSLGKLSDQYGRKVILISGLSVFACVYLAFGFATVAWQFFVLFFIYGIYMAATDGVGKAYAVDLVDPRLKATGLGLMGTISGFATILASSVAGWLWDSMGPQGTFLYGASGALLAVLILLFLRAPQKQKREML